MKGDTLVVYAAIPCSDENESEGWGRGEEGKRISCEGKELHPRGQVYLSRYVRRKRALQINVVVLHGLQEGHLNV